MKNKFHTETTKPRQAVWLLPVFLFCLIAAPGGGYLVRAAVSRSGAQAGPQTALAGVTIEHPKPTFRMRGWFSGDFQTRFGQWFGQRFALRAGMVKTDNQIGYSVFHKSNSPSAGVLVGKNNVLYEDSYVREYCNLFPRTPSEMTEQVVADMEEVGRLLRARGIGFVVLITPSKAAINSENLPPAYLARKSSTPRSYDIAVPALKRHNVLVVDGHKVLMDVKAARPNEILFCQGGVHYNNLGMLYVLRPLLQAIGTAGEKTVPNLRWNTPVPVDTQPTSWDTDLTRLLNVWKAPDHFLSPHPVAVFDALPAHTDRVRRISVVGSSFCWQPLELLHNKRVFEKADFYYYYHTEHFRYPENRPVPIGAMADEWKNTFLKSDVIVLEICEVQMGNVGDTHFTTFLRDAKKYLAESAPSSTAKFTSVATH